MFNNKFEDIIDFVTNRQVSQMEHKLKEIEKATDELKEGQQNNRYSKIISAVTDIEQSSLENDQQRKIFIQLMAQTKLNEGIDSILREYIKLVSFFALWDERTFVERVVGSTKYSEKNIKKNLDQLCDNYVYLKKGMKTLIDLKISQGTEKEKLNNLIEKLNGLDELIEKNKIYNWLPLENEINSWQHKLLYGKKYESHFSQVYYKNLEEYENTDNTVNEYKKSIKVKINQKEKIIIKLINIWRKGKNEM